LPRTYDPEFRRQAVELLRAGRPVRMVAEELGLAAATVHRWKAQDLIPAGGTRRTTTGSVAGPLLPRRQMRSTPACGPGGHAACAQQPRSNSALRTRANHHTPALLLWCNALLREGSWWASWWGSLDGMQGVRGSNPLSSTRHNASPATALSTVCQRFARKRGP
jgi:hypothetical protein